MKSTTKWPNICSKRTKRPLNNPVPTHLCQLLCGELAFLCKRPVKTVLKISLRKPLAVSATLISPRSALSGNSAFRSILFSQHTYIFARNTYFPAARFFHHASPFPAAHIFTMRPSFSPRLCTVSPRLRTIHPAALIFPQCFFLRSALFACSMLPRATFFPS